MIDKSNKLFEDSLCIKAVYVTVEKPLPNVQYILSDIMYVPDEPPEDLVFKFIEQIKVVPFSGRTILYRFITTISDEKFDMKFDTGDEIIHLGKGQKFNKGFITLEYSIV